MNQGKELGCSKGSVKYINVKMDIIFFIHANSKENDILSEDMNPVKNHQLTDAWYSNSALKTNFKKKQIYMWFIYMYSRNKNL